MIVNPISNIPKLPNSHVLAWSQVWSDQLQVPIRHGVDPSVGAETKLYIEHGVNFGGSLNLFGGADDKLFHKVNAVLACRDVTSLDWPMPDWGDQLGKRLKAASTSKLITQEWCDKVSERIKSIPQLNQEDLPAKFPGRFDGVSVGDSHTPAFSRATDVVLRENGRTLFGALKRGIIQDFRGLKPFGNVTLCYGSIDVRHHLLRHSGTLDAMLVEYVKQGRQIEKDFGCDVSYTVPVPVEFEGRKLPKTGYFKGTPFFGSREARAALTDHWYGTLRRLVGDSKVVMAPIEWYTMDPEKYAKSKMEAGGSVHISPLNYRRKDWGRTCLM